MEKHIYNFFFKTKGVVSVFLVIVLVPIVTACCLYVDASRIKMAHSVIESSGDLALNTVLSNFDADLADIYGLMASAQSDSDIKNTAKKYFKESMVSQGLESEYADNYSNMLADLFNGDSYDVHDLLQIANEDIEIGAVENGNLTNPALLKQQIVEFMKYRGPVEGVSELLDNFSKIKDTADDSKHVAKLTEHADNYYEAENKALDKLEKAYMELLNYNDVNNDTSKLNLKPGIDSAYISDLKVKVTDKGEKSIYSDYKRWHKYYVFDLCTYEKYKIGERDFSKEKIYSPDDLNLKINAFSLNNVKTSLNGLKTAYNKFLSQSNTIDNINNTMPYNDSTYDVQYWIQMQKQLESENRLENYLTLYNGKRNSKNNPSSIAYKMAKINAMAEKDDNDELSSIEFLPNPKNTTKMKNMSYTSCIFAWNALINGYYNSSQTYEVIGTKLQSIREGNKSSVEAEKTEISEGTSRISKDLSEYSSNLSSAEEHLKKAEDYLKGNIFSKGAKGHIEDMTEEFESWKQYYENNSIKDQESRETVKAQYEKAKEELDGLGVTVDSIDDFCTRIDNINDLLSNLKQAINKLKYNSKSIKDIKNFDDFAKASGVKYDKISTNKNKLNEYSDSSFSITFADNMDKCEVKNTNNPDLTIEEPEIYSWMQKKFVDDNGKPIDPRKENDDRNTQEEKFDEQENKEKDSSKKADTDGKSNTKNEIKDLDNLPSQGKDKDSGVDLKSNKKNISNMASSVSDLFKNFGTNMRDDLYLVLYISNMFTFDTFEAELKYAEENGKKDKFSDCTLTNVQMNSANNYAYQSEIEYILYGKSNSKNKTASYSTIFAVRYAFDLVWALTHFWSGNNETARAIDGISKGIAVATHGVIPAALTKLIMILGLTGMEAGSDISILKDGCPLAVFKNESVWRNTLDLSGADISKNESEIKKNNADSKFKFQYSDYLKMILAIKILANDTPILKRTADVIQANMSQKASGFLMQNANVYYKLTANCKTSLLMLNLPVIQGTIKDAHIELSSWNEYAISMYRGY